LHILPVRVLPDFRMGSYGARFLSEGNQGTLESMLKVNGAKKIKVKQTHASTCSSLPIHGNCKRREGRTKII